MGGPCGLVSVRVEGHTKRLVTRLHQDTPNLVGAEKTNAIGLRQLYMGTLSELQVKAKPTAHGKRCSVAATIPHSSSTKTMEDGDHYLR